MTRDVEIGWRGAAIAIAVTAAIAGLALSHARTGGTAGLVLLSARPAA